MLRIMVLVSLRSYFYGSGFLVPLDPDPKDLVSLDSHNWRLAKLS